MARVLDLSGEISGRGSGSAGTRACACRSGTTTAARAWRSKRPGGGPRTRGKIRPRSVSSGRAWRALELLGVAALGQPAGQQALESPDLCAEGLVAFLELHAGYTPDVRKPP